MVRMLLLPSLGPFHILHPRYNAATVLAILEKARPPVLYLASLSEEDLKTGRWREEDPLLFHLLPWAEGKGVPVVALDEEAHLKGEAEAFREALAQHPLGKPYLERMAAYEEALLALLKTPLTPGVLGSPDYLARLKAAYGGFVQAFGEGPVTGFRERRMAKVVEALKGKDGAVIAEVLDYPFLAEAFPDALPGEHEPTEAERERALLDRAWQLREGDDWAGLLEGLFAIGSPEALYLAAQIYLAAGEWREALALMEEVFRMDFQHPEYLPGYVLARFGQLLDLAGERERAIRAYRGVLALSWTPEEARAIAQAGLRTPFRLA
jgi:tetratricopeptide (TPR) repeat protein